MQLASLPAIAADIDETLSALTHNLPVYLHFFDASLPIGHGWQEVQRLTLGAHYYFVQMLTHRPALLYSAFFQSRDEAQKQAGETIEIDHSINETLSATKNITDLTHDVYFRRYSRARFEGSSATIVVAAAVTLLYDVLDPATKADHAREVFAAVERAVECLDLMPHVGPTSGKAVSLDVMRIAKEALWSNTAMAAEDSGLGQDLAEDFPWLQYDMLEDPDGGALPYTDLKVGPTQGILSDHANVQTAALSIPPAETNYISHWLEASFSPNNIPSSLF